MPRRALSCRRRHSRTTMRPRCWPAVCYSMREEGATEPRPALIPRRGFGLHALEAAFDAEPEQRAQISAEHAADERGGEPDPAVQARRRDAAEVGADVAAIGEARAVAEHQATEHRRDQRAALHPPARLEFAGKAGG